MDNPNILRAAFAGLELQKQRLDEQIAAVSARLGRKEHAKPGKAVAARRRRTMSASARKRISEAQKKRWAEYHKAQRNA